MNGDITKSNFFRNEETEFTQEVCHHDYRFNKIIEYQNETAKADCFLSFQDFVDMKIYICSETV